MTKTLTQNQEDHQQNIKQTKQIRQDNPDKKGRGRPRIKNNNKQKKSQIPNEFDANNIDITIVQFFFKIDQSNLVFDEQTRQKLISLHPQKKINPKPMYDFKSESKLIKTYVQKIQMVKTLKQNNSETKQLERELSQLFESASKFFASEVTHELYHILSTACDIVFKNITNRQEKISKLRQFGDSIPSLQKEGQYFYFGFNMFKLPKNKTQNDLQSLKKHYPHYKFILKSEFRQPNGPYADLAEKFGEFIWRIVQKTNVKKQLQSQ